VLEKSMARSENRSQKHYGNNAAEKMYVRNEIIAAFQTLIGYGAP